MVASDGSRPGRERWRRALILIQTRIIMMTKTKVCLSIVECGNQRNEKYAVGRFFQKSENLLKTMVGRQHVNRAPPSVKIGEQQLYGTSQSLL